MKKIITIFAFLLLSVFAQAQDQEKVIKLRCEVATVSYYDEAAGEFGKFEEPIKTNIVIVVGTNQVTIWSKETQKLSILSKSDKLFDKENNAYFYLYCIDGAGIRCNVIFYENRDGTYDIFLQYSDIMFVYSCNIEK